MAQEDNSYLRMACSRCGAVLRFDKKYSGRRGQCKSCGAKQTIVDQTVSMGRIRPLKAFLAVGPLLVLLALLYFLIPQKALFVVVVLPLVCLLVVLGLFVPVLNRTVDMFLGKLATDIVNWRATRRRARDQSLAQEQVRQEQTRRTEEERWESIKAEEEEAVRQVPLPAHDKVDDANATRQCPYCGETILCVAIVCKHCRSSLTAKTQNVRGTMSSGDRVESTPATYVDFKGACNIVAALCGILLVVSVFLPSVDIGIARKMFISQAPVEGVILLATGLVVLGTAIANVFLRKRLEVIYFLAALVSGGIAGLALLELKSRGEDVATAFNRLGADARWYDVVGPAMYIMLASAGTLVLAWFFSGIVHLASAKRE